MAIVERIPKTTLFVATNGLARHEAEAALDALVADGSRIHFGVALPPSWRRDLPAQFRARVAVQWEPGGVREWHENRVDLVAGRCATCGEITFGAPCETQEDQRRLQDFFRQTPLLAWVCVALFQRESGGWRADCSECSQPTRDARCAG